LIDVYELVALPRVVMHRHVMQPRVVMHRHVMQPRVVMHRHVMQPRDAATCTDDDLYHMPGS